MYLISQNMCRCIYRVVLLSSFLRPPENNQPLYYACHALTIIRVLQIYLIIIRVLQPPLVYACQALTIIGVLQIYFIIIRVLQPPLFDACQALTITRVLQIFIII